MCMRMEVGPGKVRSGAQPSAAPKSNGKRIAPGLWCEVMRPANKATKGMMG